MRSRLPRYALLALCVGVACSSGSSRAPLVPDQPGEFGENDVPTAQRDAGAPIDCLQSTGDEDADGDGFSRAAGDCDDCDLGRGPAALEVASNDIDEDCDGADATSAPASCDGEARADSVAADDAARVLGLCVESTRASRLPGVIEASWSRLNGGSKLNDGRQVWLSEMFGAIPPREGDRLLALSTGVARDARAKDYTPDCDTFGSTRLSTGEWSSSADPPDGYPRNESTCKPSTATSGARAYNDVALELTLRVPSNAKSFSFDTIFFTQEYPDFVCSPYNDFFVVFVDPPPAGHKDGNVLFDAEGDTIGVNTGLLSVCEQAEPGRVARAVSCEEGPDLLADTGFGAGESRCASKQSTRRDIGGAATGWLHTTVPVKPARIVTIRFVLWDTGDPLLDSTVLLDNFAWSLEAPEIGTRPITSG